MVEQTKKLDLLEENIATLENCLRSKGYHFIREEDGFYFYQRTIKGDENYSQEMGFSAISSAAMISYFGVASKYPISCCMELSKIADYIKHGNEEAIELNKLAIEICKIKKAARSFPQEK